MASFNIKKQLQKKCDIKKIRKCFCKYTIEDNQIMSGLHDDHDVSVLHICHILCVACIVMCLYCICVI